MLLTEVKKARLKWTWLLVFGFVLVLLGLLGFKLLSQGGNGSVKLPFTDPPAFSLNLFDSYTWEGKVKISPIEVKSQGRPLVINFWASWCIPCQNEAPLLEKLSEEYKPKGIVWLGVDYQDGKENALAFLKRFGITYPNGPDTSGEISIAYGTTGVPETWFINSEGKVVRKYIGELSDTALRSYLGELTVKGQ